MLPDYFPVLQRDLEVGCWKCGIVGSRLLSYTFTAPVSFDWGRRTGWLWDMRYI